MSIGLTIIVFTLGILIGLLSRNEQLMNSEIKIRAKSHIQHVLKTRSWNAHYGGVYVEKKEGVKSNPYLELLFLTGFNNTKGNTQIDDALFECQLEFSTEPSILDKHRQLLHLCDKLNMFKGIQVLDSDIDLCVTPTIESEEEGPDGWYGYYSDQEEEEEEEEILSMNRPLKRSRMGPIPTVYSLIPILSY